MLSTILFWVIFGGLAGLVATWLSGTDARVNGLMNVVVGVLGAVLGGFIMNALGGPGVSGFNLYSFLVAIGGAVVLLFIYRMFARSPN